MKRRQKYMINLMYDDVGRVRKLLAELQTPTTKVSGEKVIMGPEVITTIQDSVIQRSTIGGVGQKPFRAYPYCGEELNLPETPNYCPYCRKQLR